MIRIGLDRPHQAFEPDLGCHLSVDKSEDRGSQYAYRWGFCGRGHPGVDAAQHNY